MKKTYTLFDQNGLSQACITAYEDDILPEHPGCQWIEGSFNYNELIFVDEKSQTITLCEKTASAITINLSTVKVGEFLKLENMPDPTMIEVIGNYSRFRRIITDGEYEFSLDTPGNYKIKCDSGVELSIEFKVTIE